LPAHFSGHHKFWDNNRPIVFRQREIMGCREFPKASECH
jgi:hypothetical protein